MPVALMVHADDPADLICERAGSLDEVEVFNNQVLIGLYQREAETKTAGGIILTHKTTDEDKYQSKVGLILKMGPRAFTDINEPQRWFIDQDMSIGDWIVFRPSDGWAVTLVSKDPTTGKKQELLCRMIDDTAIRARIDGPMGPDRIY